MFEGPYLRLLRAREEDEKRNESGTNRKLHQETVFQPKYIPDEALAHYKKGFIDSHFSFSMLHTKNMMGAFGQEDIWTEDRKDILNICACFHLN